VSSKIVGFVAAVAVAVGVAAPGCGSSDAEGPALADPGVDDFAYEPHRLDRGSLPNRMRVLEAFRAVQRDFYAGDVEGVCGSFNRRNPTFDADACPRAVERTMEKVAAGRDGWPSYRLHWVRIYRFVPGYQGIGGVTMLGPEGKYRLQFVEVDGEWRSDFDVPEMLQGLSVPLAARG